MWEKYVFDDTYTEFLLQVQHFNQNNKYKTFSELINHTPAAEKLHFLVSSAAVGYMKQLNGKIPDVVSALVNLFLPFQNFRFEIINSHITDKSKHQVAISFYSETLTWIDTINNQLLVSLSDKKEKRRNPYGNVFHRTICKYYSLK